VNSNAPKVSPELELKLSKIMAETKVLADGYTPTPSDIDSLRKKIAELESTVDLDDCELEDGDLRSLNIGKFARATQKQLHEMLGHYGKCRGCIHCMQIKKSLGVVVKKPRAKHDPRPGHTVEETGYSDDLLPPPNMTLTPLDAATAKLICFCCKQNM